MTFELDNILPHETPSQPQNLCALQTSDQNQQTSVPEHISACIQTSPIPTAPSAKSSEGTTANNN